MARGMMAQETRDGPCQTAGGVYILGTRFVRFVSSRCAVVSMPRKSDGPKGDRCSGLRFSSVLSIFSAVENSLANCVLARVVCLASCGVGSR